MRIRPGIMTACLALFSLCSAAVADDALPIEMVQRLKNATVYVKTEIGPIKLTGSGFVIDVTGNEVLIATNQHVVAKPKELKEGTFVLGLRGRDRLALLRLQRALATAQPEVSVVFNSGTPAEQMIKAEVLGAIEEPDLALLKVVGIKLPPKPINFRSAATPVETMSLYILGFPFGDALATDNGNPTITIGKGSISSLRNGSNGQLGMIQIDGALNPGNSGGPVVDAKGDLVGIAVQTIQGSNIGMAIPPAELSATLDGRIGQPNVVFGNLDQPNAQTYEVVVPVVDPQKKLKSVSLHFVESVVTFDTTKSKQPLLQSTAGSRKLELMIVDNVAKAVLPVKLADPKTTRDITVQASYTSTGGGKPVYLAPLVLKLLPPASTSISGDGNSTTVTQTIQRSNGGTYRRQITIQRSGGSGSSKAPQSKDDSEPDSNDDQKALTKNSRSSNAAAKPDEPADGEKSDDKSNKPTSTVGWTNKIAKMKTIPDQELAGMIDGLDFKLDKATLSNSGLELVMNPRFHGVFPEASLTLILFAKRNADVSGRKLLVNGRIRSGEPHIRMTSMRKNDKLPRTESYLEYCLVLEFGQYNAKDRTQPGKIYICLPDRGKSYLAGTFEAQVE